MIKHDKEKLIFPTLLFILIFTVLTSCINISGTSDSKTSPKTKYTETDCPAQIAARAFEFAKLYNNAETEYELGGQDPLRTVKLDCSGLVIMCYKYALVDTKYSLLESDMTSAYMYQNASTHTTSPRKGDLIFMGDENPKNPSTPVSHIAIFEKFEGDEVYFIDCTKKDTNGDGIYDINGVTERHYSRDNKKIKAYGIMKLKYSD